MPATKRKLSREKTKADIEGQTFVNLTELQVYFDGMSIYKIKELEHNDPNFPDKATRTQWTLASIKEWEKLKKRVKYWQDIK